MTRGEGSFVVGHIVGKALCGVGHHTGVPSRDQHAATVGVCFNGVDDLFYLVNTLAIPVAPLMPIYGAKVPVLIGPFIPNPHAVFLKIGNVCVSFDEPQQFVNNRFEVQFLGGHHGKSL